MSQDPPCKTAGHKQVLVRSDLTWEVSPPAARPFDGAHDRPGEVVTLWRIMGLSACVHAQAGLQATDHVVASVSGRTDESEAMQLSKADDLLPPQERSSGGSLRRPLFRQGKRSPRAVVAALWLACSHVAQPGPKLQTGSPTVASLPLRRQACLRAYTHRQTHRQAGTCFSASTPSCGSSSGGTQMALGLRLPPR